MPSPVATQRPGAPIVIVNIASLAGLNGISPGLSAYVASKHGVAGATRQMAIELAPQGIRVLAIAPGMMKTETKSLCTRRREPRSDYSRPDDHQVGTYRGTL